MSLLLQFSPVAWPPGVKHPLTRPPNPSTIPTGGLIHRWGGVKVSFHSTHGELVRKKLRIAAVIGCGLLLLIAVGLGGLYWALKHQPDFYRQAIRRDRPSQKQASDQMLQQAAALRNDIQKEGRWRALFTAQQINGWLAVDFVDNFPDALPDSFRDPRVGIRPREMTLACRQQRGGVETTVTLTIEPYLPEPNRLALRIRSARAGLLPMPLTPVLDAISAAAAETGLRLDWQRAHGDPVALISIPPLSDQDGKLVEIDTLTLDNGEIYVAGTTRQPEIEGTPPETD